MFKHLSSTVPGFALWIVLIVVYLLYAPGINGPSYYDDTHSLDRLNEVYDAGSALFFVFSGDTGPLGRPLSLATFLPYAPDWKSNLTEIFTANILLHLLNGTLLFWFAFTLLSITTANEQIRCAWIALFAATIWLFLPINVSTNLIPIQRMASLSTMFVLIGLLSFIKGLKCSNSAPKLAFLLQFLGLGVATGLAALSKESGFLLVAFALVIESTVLSTSPLRKRYHTLRVILYSCVFAVLAWAFVRVLASPQEAYVLRDFGLLERLITQSVILWDYLRLAFLPRAVSYSPFHDAYSTYTSTSDLLVVAAILSWPILIYISAKWRKRYRFMSFGILWFLAGHLLESTILPLELYFEHRNYIPLIGLVIAGAYGTAILIEKHRRITTLAAGAYILLLGLTLFQTTTLWGNRAVAAEIWYINNPASPRAAQNLAILYNEQRNSPAVMHVFNALSEACPSCLSSILQSAGVACHFPSLGSIDNLLNKALARAPDARFDPGAPALLNQIYDQVKQSRCDLRDKTVLHDINTSLLDNPKYGNGPVAKHLYYNNYRFHLDNGDLHEALHQLQTALSLSDEKRDLTGLMIELIAELGDVDGAKNAYALTCTRPPLNPALKIQWQRDCRYLEEWLENTLTAKGIKVVE
ncbi:conserved membrane hypothetical protein [Thiocapsa sp. KS1]|nr:hypothetical protein [Thiocapsa sp. KS1]CRI66655.1 conserved membrane hypothetical protein [Thiocapsa sp. KS1]